MPTKLIGIFGAGGHGKETLSIIEDPEWLQANNFSTMPHLAFIETIPSANRIHGIKILSEKEFLAKDCEEKYVAIALGNPHDRKKVFSRFKDSSTNFMNVVSTKALVDSKSSMGMGAIISPFTFISTDVEIGDFFQANVNVSVSHDCKIGNYVTLSPGVTCNGNVEIRNNVFIGSGATIRNGSNGNRLVIGDNAVIGMGAVVVKNVAANTTVIGNPAHLK